MRSGVLGASGLNICINQGDAFRVSSEPCLAGSLTLHPYFEVFVNLACVSLYSPAECTRAGTVRAVTGEHTVHPLSHE